MSHIHRHGRGEGHHDTGFHPVKMRRDGDQGVHARRLLSRNGGTYAVKNAVTGKRVGQKQVSPPGTKQCRTGVAGTE